ncbi:MAG TPA: redox-sensing transcriptional repressor Rex, partial [Isosphaeraceae bacterium]|nr:redox-sensing transcriptional repressor Rex [Isosphaeraceae bacterium]
PQAATALNIGLSIVSVPAEAAQRVADQIVACGILGILNFAPIPLVVPPSVSVVAVDLSVQLEHLAYKVQNTQGGISYVG